MRHPILKARELGTLREWSADLIGGIVMIMFFLALFTVLDVLGGVSFDATDSTGKALPTVITVTATDD